MKYSKHINNFLLSYILIFFSLFCVLLLSFSFIFLPFLLFSLFSFFHFFSFSSSFFLHPFYASFSNLFTSYSVYGHLVFSFSLLPLFFHDYSASFSFPNFSFFSFLLHTFDPSATKTRTHPSPIPLLPPVTMVTLSLYLCPLMVYGVVKVAQTKQKEKEKKIKQNATQGNGGL